MRTSEEIRQRYPKEFELDAGVVPPGPQFLRFRPSGQPESHKPVSVRLMNASDKSAMLEFARSLPQEDLLFLHTDITDPASEEEWIANIEKGTTVTIVAEANGLLAGYASLQVNPLRWTRQVGEIAINVIPEWRSRGLGAGPIYSQLRQMAQVVGCGREVRGDARHYVRLPWHAQLYC